jgi:hypothetical protein
VIKGFLGGFFKKVVLLLNKILKAVSRCLFELNIVLTAYSMLLLLLRAIRESKGFIWPKKESFETGRKREV